MKTLLLLCIIFCAAFASTAQHKRQKVAHNEGHSHSYAAEIAEIKIRTHKQDSVLKVIIAKDLAEVHRLDSVLKVIDQRMKLLEEKIKKDSEYFRREAKELLRMLEMQIPERTISPWGLTSG
jgi:hypothetical protein